MGALPPLHEVASQAGIKLPQFLGELEDDDALDRLRELADRLRENSGDDAE